MANSRATDLVKIKRLIKIHVHDYFIIIKSENLFHFSEKSNIAITLVDEKNDLLGHASFFDYPNRQYTEQNKWESWFKNNYDLNQCTVSYLKIYLLI